MRDAADLDATDLDGQLRAADPDRWLASRFIADPLARADVVAIYAFDHELARAPRVASNPLIGEMRLAWWREALDEIFEGRPVRGHPTAQALEAVVSRRKLPRELLEAMIDARYRELDPAPMDAAEASRWAGESAGSAAVLSAYILDPGGEPEAARQAGAAWALHRLGGQAELLRTVLKDARGQVRRLSIAAFPAAAPAALAGSSSPSKLRKQLRLTWAVARGRL
jgi:phytoene synthase